MGLVGADIAHLSEAATAMEPIAKTVGGQAAAILAAGSLAADFAGNPMLAATIAIVTRNVAHATSDTATVVGNLRQAVEMSAANVATATGQK
jgi:hypothetical protein